MQVFTGVKQVREFSRESRRNGKTVALVPTMGYLHRGHLSLVEIAKYSSPSLHLIPCFLRQHCDIAIASLFLNPTQFAAHEDFDDYPVGKEEDRKQLEAVGCDVCFEPTSLYSTDGIFPLSSFKGVTLGGSDADFVVGKNPSNPYGYQTFVRVEQLETPLCGLTRPHFFRGVATILTKMFNIVEPNVVVLGKKDYQQLKIIERMTRELNFDIEIIGGPTVREADGLAMSSRNALIHPKVRPNCSVMFQSFQWAQETLKMKGVSDYSPEDIIEEIRDRIVNKGGEIDYVKVVDPNTLQDLSKFEKGVVVIALATFFPSKHEGARVRLIDNIEIHLT